MVQNHLSRLAAPRSWPILRKARKWVLRQHTSGHSLGASLALGVILRDLIGCVKTLHEAKYVLNSGAVIVNSVVRKDCRFAVGFMDVVCIPSVKSYYRLIYDTKGRLTLLSIPENEKDLRLLRVNGKSILPRGLIQVHFHDGTNIAVKDFSGSVGDSVLFDSLSQKIVEHFALAPQALVYLCGGSNIGSLGVVSEIVPRQGARRAMLVFDVSGKSATTLLTYAFVVGSKKKCALQVVAS